jgi:nuclear transcription Y subunit beta
MSASPPNQEAVQPVQSPDDEQPMDTGATSQGYEVEVKEQDRWLPIANGTSISLASSPHLSSHLHVDGLLLR